MSVIDSVPKKPDVLNQSLLLMQSKTLKKYFFSPKNPQNQQNDSQ